MGRAGRRGANTPLLVLAGLVFLLAIGAVLAITFAPDKPEAPPPSVATIAERPTKAGGSDTADFGGPALDDAAAFAAAGLSPSLAEQDAPLSPDEAAYVLRGLVTDTRSRAPIAAAHVRVTIVSDDPDAQRSWDVRTDEEGAYAVGLAAAARYQVGVRKKGYIVPEVQTVALGQDDAEQRVNFALSTGAIVAGRVTVGRTSSPAVDVPVVIMLPNNRPVSDSRTDATGNYSLGGLLPGTYHVTLILENTEYKAGDVLPFQSVTIARPDEEQRNINFSVDAAGVVWGYVTDPQRNPVPGARVMLCTSDSFATQFLSAALTQSAPITDQAEEDGYYELLGVPLDKDWKVYATSDDYSPQLANPFRLTANNRSLRVDVYMFGGTDVTGRVVDQRGRPVASAQIRCIPSLGDLTAPMTSARAFRDARSDSDGFFEIEQLPPGNYQVFAQKKGYKVSLSGVPIYPDGYSRIDGVSVRLEEIGEGRFACFGKVLDGREQPLDSVEVRLEGLSLDSISGIEQSTTTSADGTFRFEGIESGNYQLSAYKEGFAPYQTSSVPLEKEITIRMQTTALVSGRVLAADGGELTQGYDVNAYRVAGADGLSLASLTQEPIEARFNNPDGYYELYVPAGDYRIEATATDYTPGRVLVSVAAAEVREDVDITLPEKGGTIDGRVITMTGSSPQGTTVLLLEGSAGLAAAAEGTRQTIVAEDGAFLFENLPAGTYTVVAQNANFANASSGPVTIAIGEVRDDVVIRLGQGGVIVGTVMRNGRVMANATLLVAGVDTATSRTVTTDEAGYYEVDGLGSGNYHVAVTDLGAGALGGITEAFSRNVDVREGEVSRLDFGDNTGYIVSGFASRPPAMSIGVNLGYAFLVPAEVGPLSETINLQALTAATFAAVDRQGHFVFEDVFPGSYYLQLFYADSLFSATTLRNVSLDLIVVEGEEPLIEFDVVVGG